MGNQTSIINADGRVETNIYDEAGRLVQYVKSSKKSIKYDYDALNDLVEKSYYNSTGKESEAAVIYGYNANGERASMMDLTGDSTYEYDALGRITKVTNGAGKTVTYKYDEADNLIELGYPDGTSVLYTYDLNNNITSVTEPDGDCTTYTYDALNRVTATIRPDFTATYMTYDEESNLTVLKNVCTHCDEILSEYHYTYNEMGYVVTEEVTERVSVYCGKYHGDKEHGNFWRGKGHEYCQHEWFQYDDKGITERLEEVNALVEETSLIATTSYGAGRRGGRWFRNPAYLYCTCHTKLVTTSKSYIYDDNWQILSCTTEAAGEQAVKECYAYDEAGNRTSYERWSGLTKVESIRYEYNSSNQLTATYEQEGWSWFGIEKTLYTYDADGNLVKEEVEYRKYHDDDWYDDKHDNWWDNWFDDWFDWFGTDAVASAEEAQESEGTSLFNVGLGNQGNDKDHDNDHHRPTYDCTYTTTTYAYDTENRLKAVREQGVLLQAMTYDGDGNLAYELDYNVDAVVDGRCIYFPTHGTKAERDLYKKVCDGYGWVRGNYTLTEYLNDVTRENVEVLAEYGRNYCSMTVYTYGNERISATTFNGYGYHFGCHDNGYHNIFTQYEKWHDRWQIKDRWHNNHYNGGQGNGPRTIEISYNYSNVDKFRATYGSYSSYHSGKYCGHNWKTIMSKIYYLYDGHGSVERVHGKDGSTFRLEYDTYGNLVAGIVEKWHVWYNDIFAHRTANIYAYSGERYNVISGLQFLRARWYDTDTGRFISEDSYIGTQAEPLSRNRYIYTHNNPVNYIDPSGHWPEKEKDNDSFWEKVIEWINNGISDIKDFFSGGSRGNENNSSSSGLTAGVVESLNGYYDWALEELINSGVTIPPTIEGSMDDTEELQDTEIESDMTEATENSEGDDCEEFRGDYQDFKNAVGFSESSNNYGVVNQYGYMGRFQMGKTALMDIGFMDAEGNWTELAKEYGVTSKQEFLENHEAQDTAFDLLVKKQVSYIEYFELEKYIGITMNDVVITESGLVAASHLIGIGGLIEVLKSNDLTSIKDGNGVSAKVYIEKFGGYDISEIKK